MFNFIDIYSFIPVSGCVGMGHSALLCPGAYDVVKTPLNVVSSTPCLSVIGTQNISGDRQ
jgi:hypothetical protein